MLNNKRVWIITGASKGIGKELLKYVLEQGKICVALSRSDTYDEEFKKYNDLLRLKLDIANDSQEIINKLIETIIDKYGRIDVLVNNAGHGMITNFEETSEENIHELFETNLFGMMRVTRAVLPYMREKKSGHIFNVSSAASYSQGPVAYHTSKFAVRGFSTSLSFELAPFNIKVTDVAPGLFRTSFYDKNSMKQNLDNHIKDYDNARWQNDFVKSNSNHEQPGDPKKLAKLIYEVSNSLNPPLYLPVGKDALSTVRTYIDKLESDLKDRGNKASKLDFE